MLCVCGGVGGVFVGVCVSTHTHPHTHMDLSKFRALLIMATSWATRVAESPPKCALGIPPAVPILGSGFGQFWSILRLLTYKCIYIYIYM